MSRVLKTGTNQITNSYANHTGWSKGVDIVKKYNQCDWITAHTDGKVIKVVDYMDGTNKIADKEGMGYGNYVMILHNNKYQGKYVVTLYAHLANVDSKIKECATVTRGQTLGFMGNTGNSSGAHLHFEIRLYSALPQGYLHDVNKYIWIDPTPYIDTDLPHDTNTTPVSKAVGFLDTANYDNANGKLVCTGWAYANGTPQSVIIKIYKGTSLVKSISVTANLPRPDVKSVMGYTTDKVGYVYNNSVALNDGTYTVKAYVGTTQLTNSKNIAVKKALTATSYPDYPEGSGKYYYVQKKFKDWSTSKGLFSVWKNAYNTWSANKTSGYHVYDCNGKQLD